MQRKSESADVGKVLHEFDLLDEDRRRLYELAFRAHQASRSHIDGDVSFEKTNTLIARLHGINVYYTPADLVVTVVAEFVVHVVDRGHEAFVLLYARSFRLQQADDHVRLHETIALETHRLELQAVRRAIGARQLEFPVLGGARQI